MHSSFACAFFFSWSSSCPHPCLHSFPTRRSSDLDPLEGARRAAPLREIRPLHETAAGVDARGVGGRHVRRGRQDRKSTRLNSSHRCISYAVFCLKKKKE